VLKAQTIVELLFKLRITQSKKCCKNRDLTINMG
jgi:hypothetical protein